ncbi:MlaC/ttg2D family ABC transporter substrate-binding protein [Alcaligenes sp. SDU_A2]|uniref:MlaC/ttg2D family ABC transporter substrate-binding protein n=1 Tax=Alcaligenes sp. SDU_A2 TaxID=3136634 RepID=UPI00311F5D4B
MNLRPAAGGTALQSRMFTWLLAVCAVLALCLHTVAQAQSVDPKAAPNAFVQAVGDKALQVVKDSNAIRNGDRSAIMHAVDQYILPYVNLEKTTRLAAGRYWRQASPEQRQQLTDAFKGTLVRTYSGALSRVDDKTLLNMLPFRGDANADDVVVRSSLTQANGAPVGVDYRLEKTSDGWKIYDLNVEGIWLIQNYRNQFSQQIEQTGIDGLIQALNKQNQ